MKPTFKQYIFEIIEGSNKNNWTSKFFHASILLLIVLNLAAFSLETVQNIWIEYQYLFSFFDIISVFIFTFEYSLRVWSCTVKPEFRHPVWGRLRFLLTPLLLIDLLAILPFYLPLFFPDLRFVRAIRLFRVFRLLKLTRYSDSLQIIFKVFFIKKEELIIAFFVWFVLLFSGSSLMYFAEHEAQSDAFPNIPAAMWWGVITLTTVGYGDVSPVTPIGKVLAGILSVLGVGILALPSGIIASGFYEELQAKRKKKRHKHAIICPHCGKLIDEHPSDKSYH
ncbi:MAG TPA: potassium channel protein [Cyanobacteria bacterium UBA11149]|nr:potassium channel protein [Cyanobacteria bacterium UBA11367]HBE56095.1 potassium channel protein [Cyanobacteria bacterium UBA11366]HBK63832.1 potassium channel protein [Cyanobacteria bacterium UBA11166]HBR76305.1 potassium channel protein [Cyanobacteria bacterium UBA11159]HBS71474.1 potassium channel protein [Cyanobacteria bacterium UBA11153]HBW87616.1 potassium channel protein [Cyanobacteria bacterium UBA11149]HCA96669.1 potassium channel protein [Cyanobacteria bacterium UBA9226]